MRKILFVATVAEHFQCFYLPYFELLKKEGFEVSTACFGAVKMPNCDNNFEISITRSPFTFKNFIAYRQLKEIIKYNKFDIIHCNTPMGGVLTRIAAKKTRKHGTRVIYTAHGFHFFMGAPLKNWLVFYPIEYCLSKETDCLITINDEDYRIAKRHFKAGEIVHVHGVGYNNERFFKPSTNKRNELRRKNGFSDLDILLIYVAELNENKNQILLIKALKIIEEKNKNVRLLLIGHDELNGKNQEFAQELSLESNVIFLGKRADVFDVLPMCDIAVASSIREGLPVNIMEALACGLPVVATDNRGHRALIKNGENGFLIKMNDPDELAARVSEIIEEPWKHRMLSGNAVKSVSIYSKDRILEEMKAVYGRM